MGDRAAVSAKYERWLADQHQLLRALDELLIKIDDRIIQQAHLNPSGATFFSSQPLPFSRMRLPYF
jgi:hypothetical protein